MTLNRTQLTRLLVITILTMAPLFLQAQELNPTSNKVKLKASQTYYKEDTKVLIASGNVSIQYGDVIVEADRLYFDTYSQTIWGTGKIIIKRDDDQFESSYLHFDLKKNEITIRDIHIAVEVPDGKAPIFLKAQELIDMDKIKKGSHGLLTTCDYDDPHYFVWAQHFNYYQEKRIIAYNVFFYHPILFIPFGLWTPFYMYDVGKREIVWNFPTIGKKTTEGWGWFVQNQIDYNNIDGNDSSVFVDWYENKGWGLGFKHQYKLGPDQPGSVYFYNLRERDTKQINNKKSIQQQFKINDPFTLNVRYSDQDAERINRSGRDNKVEKGATIKYDNIGFVSEFSIDETQNFKQLTNKFSTSYKHAYNKKNQLKLNYDKTEKLSAENVFQKASLYHQKDFAYNFNLTNKMQYQNNNDTDNDLDPDEKLIYNFTLKNQLTETLDFTMNIDHFIDLDEENITSDSKSSGNDYFFKHPEFILNNSHQWKKFRFNEKFTFARYQEVKYDSSTGKQRIFPDDDNFEIQPNTYIFNQTVKRSKSDLPFETNLSMDVSYDQYIFKVPENDLFSGDAMYTTKLKLSQRSDYFGFLQQTTTYETVGSPDNNNSPFHKFDRELQSQNKIRESLKLYLISPSKYSWDNSSGFNWVEKEWDDYRTTLLINPARIFKWTLSTGKKLNFSKSEKDNRFAPLSSQLTLNPLKHFTFDHTLKVDLNEWRDNNNFTVINSNFNLDFKIGLDPDFQWSIKTLFTYNKEDQTGKFETTRYKMQRIDIVKKEHKRTLTVSYYEPRDELRFKFTVDAFPKDSVGFKKSEDIWKVEGILDDKSEERF